MQSMANWSSRELVDFLEIFNLDLVERPNQLITSMLASAWFAASSFSFSFSFFVERLCKSQDACARVQLEIHDESRLFGQCLN